MTTNMHRESARIYTFPIKARPAADVALERGSSVVSLASKRAATVSYGAWYHEEAVQQAARDDKN